MSHNDLWRFCLCIYKKSYSALLVLLGVWGVSQFGHAFEVQDSSHMQFERAKVYGWYVKIRDNGNLVGLSENSKSALTYHQVLSVYGHAKSVTQNKLSLRYVYSNKQFKNYAGLVTSTPMSIKDAQQKARIIGISPETEQVTFAPRIIPYALTTEVTPNDQCYQYQRSYLGTNNQFHGSAEVNHLWPSQGGTDYSTRASIAVLDSGIVNHEDFGAEQRIFGWDYISNPALAGDGNGRDEDATDPGFSDDCTSSSGFHGTHVASIAASKGNNDIGIAGVSWSSPIVALRVIGVESGDLVDVFYALQDLPSLSTQIINDHNAAAIRVANLSLGAETPDACPRAFIDSNIVTTLLDKNILTIIAAGNNHADAGDYSPANCPGVLTVLSTNHQGGKAHYSNYGTRIDLAAPGGEEDENQDASYTILAAVNNNHYEYKQGTSMAAPVVSGIVAQLAGYQPSLTAREIRNIMLATSQEHLGNNEFGLKCDTSLCGAGIVSGQNALEHIKSGLRFVFFPRQLSYLPVGTKGKLDVHMTRTSNTETTFRLLVNSDACSLTTTEYSGAIPAGELSARFNDEDTLTLADENCTDVTYTISLADANGNPLNTTDDVLLVKDYNRSLGSSSSSTTTQTNTDTRYNGSTRHTLRVIRKSADNFSEELVLNQPTWQYLAAGTRNIHRAYIPQTGKFIISTVSDMDMEMQILANGSLLYDTREDDPFNDIETDYSLWFNASESSTLVFRFSEHFNNRKGGGVYALALTKAPNFNQPSKAYCEAVTLGVSGCSSSTDNEGATSKPHSSKKKSGSAAIGTTSLFALLALALFARYRRRL